MTRGVKHWRDIFVQFMQTQMWAWKRKNLKTKKWETTAVQGALRPVELWEYVFPEECLDEVLTMINARGTQEILGIRGAALRKALGKDIKPIPKYKDKATHFVQHEAMAIYPIGIKKDERRAVPKDKHGDWGYEQEML